MTPEETAAIANRCTRWLSGHRRERMRPRPMLEHIAAALEPDTIADVYGSGALIADFEGEIAALLGKESAVFMPSGTMAQQIALRIWSERNGSPRVGFHPTCHLELHEQMGYAHLHRLHGILVGQKDRLMTVDDLRAVESPLAALLVELPQREIGGQLPDWEGLSALVGAAHERGAATHLDGARLWECAPWYGRPYAEIARLFDTVYVSFYKILGGITGAALAGPADLIEESRIWQRRHGGNLYQLYPYVLSARMGLRERLGRMSAYRDKAVEIAGALARIQGIAIVPHPPQTNMMHVYLSGDRGRLEEAALAISRETGLWLFHPLRPGIAEPERHFFELSAGDATCDLDTEEVAAVFQDLMERARE